MLPILSRMGVAQLTSHLFPDSCTKGQLDEDYCRTSDLESFESLKSVCLGSGSECVLLVSQGEGHREV